MGFPVSRPIFSYNLYDILARVVYTCAGLGGAGQNVLLQIRYYKQRGLANTKSYKFHGHIEPSFASYLTPC